MPTSSKSASHFTEESKLEQKDSSGLFSHPTRKVTKTIPKLFWEVPKENLPAKYKYRWYLKDADSKQRAQSEVIVQELFRLFIPDQPKTRLVISRNGKFYVASKEIPEHKDLLKEANYTDQEKIAWNNALRNGTITGIGGLTLFARLFHELDLKNGNVKINYGKKLIKLDGDWGFARLRDGSISPITAQTIADLPLLGANDNSWNWLGCKYMGVYTATPILDPDLSTNPRIRAEINYALLKALVMPDQLIKNFIAHYINEPSDAKPIYDEFIDRRNQLRVAAMQNQDFLNYLKSDQAAPELGEYINYLKTFTTTGKNTLFQTMSEPEKQILLQFQELQLTASQNENLTKKDLAEISKADADLLQKRDEQTTQTLHVSSPKK